MNDITTVWKKLNPWMAANAPELEQSLQQGANSQEILELEQHLGVTLPEDYKLFLGLCNGQADDALAEFYNGELLSIANIKFQWDAWKNLLETNTFSGISSQPDKGIRNDWWNLKWIPFTHDGGGNHFCLDLAPANGGHVGQVITMWHDSSEREFVASNFTAWLEDILNGVETGAIVFDAQDYNALIDNDS